MIYRKFDMSQEYSIENPGREDLQESFEAYVSGIPAYGLKNFWVAKKGGEIVACAGLWDCSYFADLYYAREPAALKAMGRIFSLLGRLIKLPNILRKACALIFA